MPYSKNNKEVVSRKRRGVAPKLAFKFSGPQCYRKLLELDKKKSFCLQTYIRGSTEKHYQGSLGQGDNYRLLQAVN